MGVPFQSTGTRNSKDSLLSSRACRMMLSFFSYYLPSGVLVVSLSEDNILKFIRAGKTERIKGAGKVGEEGGWARGLGLGWMVG
jgi:hypothetical protein